MIKKIGWAVNGIAIMAVGGWLVYARDGNVPLIAGCVLIFAGVWLAWPGRADALVHGIGVLISKTRWGK